MRFLVALGLSMLFGGVSHAATRVAGGQKMTTAEKALKAQTKAESIRKSIHATGVLPGGKKFRVVTEGDRITINKKNMTFKEAQATVEGLEAAMPEQPYDTSGAEVPRRAIVFKSAVPLVRKISSGRTEDVKLRDLDLSAAPYAEKFGPSSLEGERIHQN